MDLYQETFFKSCTLRKLHIPDIEKIRIRPGVTWGSQHLFAFFDSALEPSEI